MSVEKSENNKVVRYNPISSTAFSTVMGAGATFFGGIILGHSTESLKRPVLASAAGNFITTIALGKNIERSALVMGTTSGFLGFSLPGMSSFAMSAGLMCLRQIIANTIGYGLDSYTESPMAMPFSSYAKVSATGAFASMGLLYVFIASAMKLLPSILPALLSTGINLITNTVNNMSDINTKPSDSNHNSQCTLF